MDFKCLGKNGMIFIDELSKVIPEYIEKGKIEKLKDFNIYTLNIEDSSTKESLRVSYVTCEELITIGYDVYDHKHFSKDVDGENFIEKSIQFLNKVYKKD